MSDIKNPNEHIINYANSSKITLTTALLIFYLAVSGTFTDSLFSKQFKNLVDENRNAQHCVAFTRLFITIVLIANITDFKSALFYSILCYIWFIFTTKLDLEWNLLIFGLLLLGFIYENIIQEQDERIMKDDSLSEKEVEKIKKHNKWKKLFIMLAICGITILGTCIYGNKKITQYGSGFNLVKFFFNGPNTISDSKILTPFMVAI